MAGVKGKCGGKREGAGRTTLIKGVDKAKITLSLAKEAIEKLDIESDKTKLSRSDILSELIIKNL